MKKSEFVTMIREIVAEEVRRQLPNIMSEMYIRRVVEESMVNEAPSEFMRVFERGLRDEEEDIPEPLDNSLDGIYDDSGPIRRKNEVVSRLLSSDNPYAAMYENIVPLNERKPLTSATMIPGANGDPTRFGKFFQKMTQISEQKAPMKNPNVERELEMKRKQLDELKVG